MACKFKSAELVFPPAPPPLPSGSIYANPGYPRATFRDESGAEHTMTLSDLRDVLVHKTRDAPKNIPFCELRAAFRIAITLMPHTHSNTTNADVAAANNPHPDDPGFG